MRNYVGFLQIGLQIMSPSLSQVVYTKYIFSHYTVTISLIYSIGVSAINFKVFEHFLIMLHDTCILTKHIP